MSTEVEIRDVSTSKKPKGSKFYQQKLWAWQPILTASNICPYFYVIAVLFIPLGAFFLVTSNRVSEISIPYTHCSLGTSAVPCAEQVKNPSHTPCRCTLNFTLETDLSGPLYVFYGLTNFFQNHRRYVMSRDDEQLNGKPITVPSADCDPYRYSMENNVKKIIAPCGAIANSLFNDTFTLKLVRKKNADRDINLNVGFSTENIAWKSDRDVKFGRPASWAGTTKPINWPKPVQEISPDAYSGYSQLLVWMRTAALPNFRKNYADIVHKDDFVDGLPAGFYEVEVQYSYPVTQFSGTKRFIISQASWLGGRNPTLGIAYITTGCIHAVLAVIFTVIHFHLRRRCRRF